LVTAELFLTPMHPSGSDTGPAAFIPEQRWPDMLGVDVDEIAATLHRACVKGSS
jgi:hypothetical protein